MPVVKVPIRVHENKVAVTAYRVLMNVRAIDAFDYTHACEVLFKGKRITAYLNRDGQWYAFIPHLPLSSEPTQAFDAFKEKYLTGLFR